MVLIFYYSKLNRLNVSLKKRTIVLLWNVLGLDNKVCIDLRKYIILTNCQNCQLLQQQELTNAPFFTLCINHSI